MSKGNQKIEVSFNLILASDEWEFSFKGGFQNVSDEELDCFVKLLQSIYSRGSNQNIKAEREKNVILQHKGKYAPCFDLFSNNSNNKEAKNVYRKDCPYVKRYLEKNPTMFYIGSEDLDHLPESHEEVLNLLERLEEEGWVVEGAKEKGEIDEKTPVEEDLEKWVKEKKKQDKLLGEMKGKKPEEEFDS